MKLTKNTISNKTRQASAASSTCNHSRLGFPVPHNVTDLVPDLFA